MFLVASTAVTSRGKPCRSWAATPKTRLSIVFSMERRTTSLWLDADPRRSCKRRHIPMRFIWNRLSKIRAWTWLVNWWIVMQSLTLRVNNPRLFSLTTSQNDFSMFTYISAVIVDFEARIPQAESRYSPKIMLVRRLLWSLLCWRDILHTSDEFFSVQDIGTVINFVCSFNLFLYLIMYFVCTILW